MGNVKLFYGLCIIFLLLTCFASVVRADSMTRVVFDSSDDIWIFNGDGSGLERLTNTPNIMEWGPALSPDGNRILYTIDAGGQGDIWGMDLNTKATYPVVTGPNSETRADWSPDGNQILFIRYINPWDIRIIIMASNKIHSDL